MLLDWKYKNEAFMHWRSGILSQGSRAFSRRSLSKGKHFYKIKVSDRREKNNIENVSSFLGRFAFFHNHWGADLTVVAGL